MKNNIIASLSIIVILGSDPVGLGLESIVGVVSTVSGTVRYMSKDLKSGPQAANAILSPEMRGLNAYKSSVICLSSLVDKS